ncbi:hypothetical protein GCM10007082_16270 [Oceanisphaera arctica]|nr:hypothetical protein GCM10007082_16270 [Oceanisphaera arctica]
MPERQEHFPAPAFYGRWSRSLLSLTSHGGAGGNADRQHQCVKEDKGICSADHPRHGWRG